MLRDPRERDRVYLGWVARLPCVACLVRGTMTREVQVAHLRAGSEAHGKRPTGGAEKPSDRWTLPLCQPHHTGDRRKVDLIQHDMNELEFWAAHGIDPFGLCVELRAAYEAGRAGIPIIARHAAAGRQKLEGGSMPIDFANADATEAAYRTMQKDGTIPTKALSIKQPWAWLIVHGHKDIENRSWLKRFPPRVLVHAGRNFDDTAHRALIAGRHPARPMEMISLQIAEAYEKAFRANEVKTGGVVGVTDIVGVQEDHDSPWFVGDYGYILANARPLAFLPWRGELGFFEVKVGPR